MAETGVAKLFRNGRSQAVRLPRAFRFEGSEVNIRRDPKSGEVILSPRQQSWQNLFALLDRLKPPEGFMIDRKDVPPQKRKTMF